MATLSIEGFLASKGVTESERKNAHIRNLKGVNGEYKALVIPWALSDQVDKDGNPVTALFLSPSKNLNATFESTNTEFSAEWVMQHKGELQVAEFIIATGPRAGQQGYSLCLVDQSEAIDLTGF